MLKDPMHTKLRRRRRRWENTGGKGRRIQSVAGAENQTIARGKKGENTKTHDRKWKLTYQANMKHKQEQGLQIKKYDAFACMIQSIMFRWDQIH